MFGRSGETKNPGTLWRLNHPFVQNVIAGMMLFCLPGIYLALTGLGAGGGRPSSQAVAANVNAILYGVFFLVGWFGGSIMNIVGPNVTISLSAIGYALYTGGLWYFDQSGNSWLAYLGGALDGVCGGLLWATVNAIAFGYAEEKEKALYLATQWVLCQTGSTLAAIVALGINMQVDSETKDAGAPNAVYIVFVVIQVIAMVLALMLLVRPKNVVRSDGTRLAIFQAPTVKNELLGMWQMVTDFKFMMLLPPMIAAEMALALQSSLNGFYFNLRTRSLNNVMFNFIQIPASFLMTWILDSPRFGQRKTRALIGITAMSAVTLGICAAEAGWLVINDIDRTAEGPSVDWTDSAFVGPFVIYIIYGSVYSIYQIATQYVITALTNDPERLARMGGVFRGMTAFGMMFSFIIDGNGGSYISQLIFQFVCYFVGIVFLYIVTIKWVTDSNYFSESSVIVPEHVKKEAVIEGRVTYEDVVEEHRKESVGGGKTDVESSVLQSVPRTRSDA